MKEWIAQRKRIGIWAGAALAALVFVLSSLFPKTSYHVEKYHVVLEEGEQERDIVLTPETTVLFSFSVGETNVGGVQPCLDWGAESCPPGVLCVDVWQVSADGEQDYVGQGSAPLNAGLRRSYTYVALPHEGALCGELILAIRYAPAEGEESYPSLIATDRDMDECLTVVNGEPYAGDLLMYYASEQDTYPLLFDAKLICLLLICVALTMGNAQKKEVRR
ncbi:MAG: hypothetical protein K2N41_10520 [Lachnospiraceae bacterium]|nr:hypothetical protein [Lachnospiraceae bacterium]MDE7240126.1 hypothetical protein [Lachnospiraceae bacterium]